jgi:hypothetical protein
MRLLPLLFALLQDDRAELLRTSLANGHAARIVAEIKIEENGQPVDTFNCEFWVAHGEGKRRGGAQHFKGSNDKGEFFEAYVSGMSGAYRKADGGEWKKTKGIEPLRKEGGRLGLAWQELETALFGTLNEAPKRSTGPDVQVVSGTYTFSVWGGGIATFEKLFPNSDMMTRNSKMNHNAAGSSTVIEIDPTEKRVLKVTCVSNSVEQSGRGSITIRLKAEYLDYGKNFLDTVPKEVKGE